MVTTASLRVYNHNNWPIVELFQCEKEFIERMARKNIQQIFVTANLTPDDLDEPFNAAVGHILDCLDCLPRRPDAAFDSLYKVIDQTLNAFSVPNIPRMRATVNALFSSNNSEWENIVKLLTENIPQQTADYAASRILECYIIENPPHSNEVKKRAARSLGRNRYEEFRNKFLVWDPQDNKFNIPYENKRNAGRLMRKMLRQNDVTNGSHSSPASLLDLSVASNLLKPAMKLEVLMEICLATYRHERFHGEAFTPFRSSKAKLKTYAHAYYMVFIAYTLILGMLQLQGKGGLTIKDIVSVTSEGMSRFTSFFENALDE